MSPNILIVDDESSVRKSFARVLRGDGYTVRVADCAQAALNEVRKADPDVVLLDIHLPDTNGLDVLATLKERNEKTVVIAMTAYENAKDATLAMKRGAYDYLSKPSDVSAIRLLVGEAIESARTASQIEASNAGLCQKTCPSCSCPLRRGQQRGACRETWQKTACEQMVGTSPAMSRVLDLVHRVPATSGSNVLIEGETGTGKELLARAVHELSSRANEPFVAICSGAIPRELMESELFGYEGGAYTGSRPEGRTGVFELAAGGTLFLDEIGELDLGLQVKLLRVLEVREFRRVGGTRKIPLLARLVAATNRHLKDEVEQGKFRADLYYRLNVLRITLPPLRERPEDIVPLTQSFLLEFNALFGKNFESISAPARRLLEEYPWPGNIRELRNVIERIALMESGDTITPDQLPQEIVSSAASALRPLLPTSEPGNARLIEIEKDCIAKALERAGGNVVNAARLLGVKRGALRYRMSRLGISKDGFIPRSLED